ncbi:stabilin-2 isoform X2 [Salarias fasciatus]|uniref:stabilin-2 isoform X2 n=1 Tax=Salarias fasciatus TaxID=181472 RepID=UPI0011768496|nr:stabilin-2 isoform X2 [Salarias fasciatus]
MELSQRTQLLLLMMMMAKTAASQKNFCSTSTVGRTRTPCHSCTISGLIPCPVGYRRTPGSRASDCTFNPGMLVSLARNIKGCSFECYRDMELKRCCPGFWGPDCNECPDRADRPCSGRGTCSDGLGGNGTCSCQDGFTGSACEDCLPGRYGSTCSSGCSCVHGLCDSGPTGTGQCTCFSGYGGPNCDQELPECASLRCQANSRCMEEALTGRLVCQCKPGYQKSGSDCISINPCLQSVCHIHATCVHTGPNKHQCTCSEGYGGDGRVCMPVDPCQTGNGGCSEDSARCIYLGPGASDCECLPGFEGLWKGSCSLKDACTPDSCHKDANCSTVGPGQVECTCLPGYVGTGKVCYGNIMQRLNELNTEPGGQWSGQLSNAITLFGSLTWRLQNLGPFTIFVPTNRGFQGIVMNTLMADESNARYLCKMHLVAGVMPFDTLKRAGTFYTLTGRSAEMDTSEGDSQAKIRIHGSRKRGGILLSDTLASNGMIHIINKLMDSVSPTVESNPQMNLLGMVSDISRFQTFKMLLERTGLSSELTSPGPFTVFAPNTAAFDAMTEGYLQYLRSSEGRYKLLEFMRNHLVSSTSLEVFNAVSNPRIMSAANQILNFNVTENGQILVNGAAVLEAAVEAKNGRLYVLDGVLTPASIEPLLPHRCDVQETKVTQGECVSCSKVSQTRCSSGVQQGSIFGCTYSFSVDIAPMKPFSARGCAPLCNSTVTTAACCKGFYGPDCRPCPGGYQTPCSGHGQCSEGIEGNGSCICEKNFGGSSCQYCSSSNKYGPKCDRTCPCVHGKCDNRPNSDGRCKSFCQSGFVGRFCDRQTSPCGVEAHRCHAHADCDFSDGTGRCVCRSGYQGDGIMCVESDPCAPPLRGGCSVNAKCIKTGPGTRTCQCLTGWTEDGDECQPINNCNHADRGGCHDNATCIYVGPGQSDCMCKAGYHGNGQTCEPVNQCVTVDGGCHYLATCRLRFMAWTCVCDDGYVGNGRVCYGSVEQELRTLPDSSDFFTWMTASGLSSSLSDQNITLLVPSRDAVSKMSPEDKTFWTMKGNLPSLIRNHIISGTYSSSELSGISSITSLLSTTLSVSTSSRGLTVAGATITTSDLAATNGLIHIIDQVLVPDRKQSEGLLATLALRPDFSLFRSALLDHNLTDEIQQNHEFTVFAPTDAAITEYLRTVSSTALDVNTTRYHVVPAQRLLRTDLQQGGYKQTLLGFSFQLGIYPRDGKLFVNEAQVDTFNILSGKGVIHGLTAVLPINRNRCDKVTYKRFLGECIECLFHQNKLCPNDTTPDVSVKPMRCKLVRVFGGERRVSLGCRATCMRKNTEPRCCAGFFGAHCEPCPGPTAQPCSSNGACSDGVDGSGVCRCSGGFNGTACETCQGGKYGVHCDQECDCKNGRCSDGLRGDGTCECDVGWRGVHCDQKIESTADELCGSVKCHSSANCVIPPSGPACLCAAGFTGNGTSCTAVDPCLVDNGGCGGFAVCKRTRPGRRDCVCNRGYAGDGLVCVEINPCLEGNGGCHADAECIHVGPNKTSCACRDGYSGDGLNCDAINLCQKENGGCPRSARCNMTGPGTRSCTCKKGYIGDGMTCKGSVMQELMRLNLRGFDYDMMMAGVSLHGRGPFTIFAPNEEAHNANRMGNKIKMGMADEFENHVRSHIVMCHTLLPADLSRPRNLTSLSGYVLTTGVKQGTIFVNQANVTRSDDESFNGIIHEINMVLNPLKIFTNGTQAATDPKPMNLTDVADLHGYKTFYKLLEDTGVMDMVNDVLHQPVTVFLPSDAVMASLPQEQKDFLFDQHNRPQLLEYLKYHIVQGQRVHAEDLVYLDSARTLQGSLLSFVCGDVDNIGAIFVNDERCRIVQRHLGFRGGIAYGIDCLLTPPSLGGRCDEYTTVDLTMKCRTCFTSSTRCPDGTKRQEMQKCDLPSVYVTKNSGCRSICRVGIWKPKCCRGYYGRDCLACPGGARSPCNNRGTCDDGHLGNGTCACEAGFGGVACELCSGGFYGPMCKACNCSEHGSCEDGRRGTGLCFCEPGWTGDRCDVQTEVLQCSPPCSPKAVCQDNNTCVCRPFYQGDGYTCTPVDVCNMWNGGCAKGATCSQNGEVVTCTCPKGHTGDGFSCQPVDPCASGENGGCHEHAICTMAAPGKKKCSCKDGYIGDGLTCEVKQLPISRCLQDNGGCHQDAKCTDLHFEDATLGVFHYRSERGQYKLNYTAAQQACTAAAGGLATYTQLSYAQQAGMNMCAAGWLDQARVAYPTTYSNPNCGFGHVGIVDYGTRKNLSETWDTFCYRMKEVQCECRPGYVGDGFSCTGNLLQVLRSTPTFSNFLTQILNFSQVSESGKQFVKRLSNLTVRSTLFVPDNSGLPDNQTLSQRDIEFHLSEGQALPLSQLRNGSRIRTRVGSLSVLGVADLLDPNTLSSRYINDRFVTTSDILAANGIIHVLQGPLKAPPPSHQMAVAHKAGMGVGVVLLLLLVAGVLFVGYHFYSRSAKPFRFHYFKEDEAEEEEEDAPPEIHSRNISNPVYEPGPEQAACSSDSGSQQVEDKHQVVISGVFDLLQES